MAFLLAAVMLSLAPSAPAEAVYRCLDDTMFTLSATKELAIVRFSDRQYRLPRRSSALAVKYATETATLYLDGDFAAFIAEDRPLPGCFRVPPGRRG